MNFILAMLSFLILLSCQKKETPSDFPWLKENPKILSAHDYKMDSPPVLINGARIMTAAGDIFENANLLMENGIIQKISQKPIEAPSNGKIIDGKGLTLTPGIIDVHSHMGVYPSPSVDAHADGNEMVRPVTADVWAEHGFWPQDPDLWRALAGGITTIQVLPGSGNLFGGRSFTAKLLPQLSAREMRFPGAPQGLKMACGENPKRVYKEKELMTRMGNVARYRSEFQQAVEYLRSWENCPKCKDGELPKRNFIAETLAKVLKGEILIHFHCYRADDISAVLDLAQEFGFKIRTIHHGLEAYKIAPRLAKEQVSVATWADWWGFKAEAFDGIPYNIALLQKSGAKAIVHSDSPVDVRYLNLEAGKALSSARQLGLNFTEDQALAWVTKNAAWALGLEDKIGTLEKGKMADIVAWDGHPFSAMTKAKMVFINGDLVFDRENNKRIRSDFEVGFNDMAFHDGRDFNPATPPLDITWPDSKNPMESVVEGKFVIENVNAFIKGAWEKGMSIAVENGVIKDIGKELSKSDFKKINGENKHLTPGLVESRSSLGLYDISLDSRAQDLSSHSIKPTPHYRAAAAVNLQNIRLPIHRTQGVTTSIAHLSGGVASGFGTAFDLKPDIPYLDSDVALFGNLERRGKDQNRITNWSNLTVLIDEAVIYSKNPEKFLSGKTHNFKYQRPHLKAMVPIIKGIKPWVIEANRLDDIHRIINLKKKMAQSGVTIKFVIAGAAESWMATKELVKNQIPLLITPTAQTPTSFNKTKARFDLAAYLQKEGVLFGIFDSSDLGAVRLRQEAAMAVKYGLSPDAALTAITKTPALIFGLDRGELKLGARANIVLWSGNPLEPTSIVKKVWVGGKDLSGKDRQRQLADKYL